MAEDQDIQEPPVQTDSPQGDPDKPPSGPTLAQTDRDRLAGIVQKMKDNGESDDNILTAVNGFKQKYGQAPGGPKDATPKSAGGPTPGQAKSAVRDIRNIGAAPSAPDTSMNPAVKPFKSYEDALNGLSETNQRIQALPQTLNSPQGADYYQKTMPGLQAASTAYKGQLTAEEVKAGGTLKDIDGQFLKDSKNYITPDGTLDYGKIHDAALAASQQYGGDRAVGEVIYNRAANALKFQQMKPDVEAEFKRLSGQSPSDFLGGSKTASDIGALKSHYQNDFTTEATRSQDIISKAASNIFTTKYQPALEAISAQHGQDSPEFKQAYAAAQQHLTGDLRDIQVKENARLLRIRSEMSRQMGDQVGDVEGKDQGLMDNYNTLYNKAYQNVQQSKDAAKSLVYSLPDVAGGNMAKLFFQSLWSGANSWAATRGAGLVGVGFNNPLTDWMRSRQTAAESNDIPAGPAGNPATYAASAGKMIGQMLPDVALTALTKNPTLSGLEFTASSTLSGMGDVYNQSKADGYNEVEAQSKAMDFAHKNFITTLPANMLMGASILANLKGAGGFLANTAKEVAGGLGAALPQQYLTQAQSKEGKTLGQFLREDAPQSALENLIALAAGAPIMRAVGHLTSAMGEAKVNAADRQFYSDLIDKQGPNAAHATLELQYLNGALDEAGLTKAKALVDDIVKTKTGLTQLDVHPDHQKLFLETQHDIQDLQTQHAAATDDTVKKLLETKIKEKQGQAQDALTGKASYVKFTTPTGNDFVVPMDKAEATMADPAVQRDMAAGTMRTQAFGDEKEIAPMTQRINEINTSATNAKTAAAATGEVPIEPVAPEAPQITEVRHGETKEDESGHVSGTDGIPLNETGLTDADKLADDAERRGFTKVVGSDVARNIETAKTVADKLGVPHEIIPGFNSWDVGQFNGATEAEYNKAEQYFVQHPDATEFDGKQINETFNQYKDRIIKARTDLEEKNQGNTLLVNHSGNMNVWEAYKASGDKWDEAAKEHYLNAVDAEPAVLPPTKEEEAVATDAEKEGPSPELERAFHEEKAIMDVHDPEKESEVTKLFEEELKKINDEKTNESGGPIRAGSEPEAGNSGADAAPGRSEAATPDQERVRPDDKTESGGGDAKGDAGKSESGRFSTRDEFERAIAKELARPKEGEETGKSEKFTSVPETVKGIRDRFKDDPMMQRALDFVEPILSKNSAIRFDPDYDWKGDSALGYSFPDGRIAVNHDRVSGEDADRVAVHEMVHAATRSEIERNPAFKEDLRDILNEIRAGLKLPDNDAVISAMVQRGIIPDDHYGAANEHELVAEVFSNAKFNDLLKNTQYKGDSLLKRVFIGIAKYFSKAYRAISDAKGNISVDNMADYLMKLTEQVVKAPGEDEAGALPKAGDEESKIRKMIQRAPDTMTDADISQSIQKATGRNAADADDLVKSVRDEQTKGLAGLVEDALNAGKQTLAQAKANAPKVSAPPKGIAKILGRWFFDKQDDVSDVKSIIRQNKGNEEFQADQVWKASNKALNEWNKVPTKQQLQFILGMERPDLLKGSSPETLAAAQAYRDRLDKVYDVIKKALPNINFTEDYFPHFWEKPDEVKNYFASTLSKQPMEGSKAFAKQRFFDTILEGLRKGYKLTTTNPEELVRLAEANAWKFQTARAIFDDMKKMGYLKYSTAKDLPADWQGVDDKMFNKIGAYVDKDGNANLAMGQYMMPPDVAAMMNRYLSLGLKGSVPDFIRNYNNIKNAFQLGVGAFHLGTTSLESTVSGVARGIQLLTTLRPNNMLNGLGQIAASATFVPNLAMDLRRGWKAMNDYHSGMQTADVMNLVNANAKVGQQKMYALDAKYNMMKSFGRLRADGDFKQIPKMLWNSLLYLPESINKPLMEKWVPGLKVGGYLRSLDAEMASRKNMTPAALQQAKEKIWDSMDDRLGQVVYDNRFMNKTIKDLGFMSIRSLGWTGGTLAAGAKGIGEIPLSGKRMIHREGMTQRTAYLFALPMTVGLYGAYYMMMTSGQAPQTAQDYFYPKDGTQNPDGTDHRVDLPSYMKDMISYWNSPMKTLVNKTSPIINDAIELYKNKDFYGAKIYGEDDPWYQRGLEKLQYLGGNMVPFSFKQKPGDEKSMADQFTTRQGLEQKFGIMPAPKEMERTDTQNKIMAAYGKQFGSEEGKTQDEMEQQIARRHLRDFLHNGGTWNDASDELKSKANISDAGQQKFINDSALDPFEKDFRGLPKAEKIKLFEQMSDDEQEQYKKYMPDDYNPNQ